MKQLLLLLLLICSTQLHAQHCGFDIKHQQRMNTNPEYKAKVAEMNAYAAAKAKERKAKANMQGLVTTTAAKGTVYEIPIVVHVIHTGGSVGSTYNPSDSTIESMIDYVNETYEATYSSYPDTNSGGVYFPVKFVLAQRDDNCNSTTGINRVDFSSSTAYVNNGINVFNSNGEDETVVKALSRYNNKAYLNIWIVNEIDNGSGGILGYAYLGGATGDIDGVVMLASQVGAGKATLPHEIGHVFGLYHTFEGDGTGSTCPTNNDCTTDGDLVCDTEPHKRTTGSCGSGSTNTCVSATYDDAVAKNIMNYATCRDRFTEGQKERFMDLFLYYRTGLASSMGGMDSTQNVVAASCVTTTTNSLSAADMGPIHIKLNDLENSTGGQLYDNFDYHDYTCQMRANVIQGETYTLEVATYNNAQKKRVYIDYNNDGAFDGTERIANLGFVTYGSVTDTDRHTVSYTVPTSGVTTCTPLRMRVLSIWGNSSWPNNTGCGTLLYGQSEDYTVVIKPSSTATEAVVSSHPICTGGGKTIFEAETSGTFTSPSYQWYKNGSAVGSDSVLYPASGLVTGDVIQLKVNYTDACYDDSVFSDAYTVTTQTDTNTWVGYDNTTYGDKDNWSCGSKPVVSETVIVDGSRLVNAPVLNNVARSSKNLWLINGASVAYDESLELTGDITIDDSSTLDLSSGTLILKGSSAQTLTFGETADKTVTIKALELNNSAGASFGTYGIAQVDSVYIPTSGTLTTNGKLLLHSDASQTAYIAAGSSSGGYISGSVTAEKYVPGKRTFRFVAHPFTGSIALSELTDDIDITGSGGSSNGFTTTASNNPSAFWFNVNNADTTTAGNNPGWIAFTSTGGFSTNSWDQYELMRILIRGDKGEGLTGGSYTPSDITWDYSALVNQGTQTITLTKGTNSEFVGCGNPFPSGIQMSNVSKGSNVGANYYAWDATSGAAGAYVTNPWTMSYVLPAYSAFFTTVSANSNNTLTIEEADKSDGGTGLFKGTANDYWVELSIDDTNIHWDRLLIGLDNNSMSVEDDMDGKKLYNPGLDFYTLSKDNIRLAVDVRPYSINETIPLGLTAYNRYNRYVIKTGMYNVPAGTKLYLHDTYLNNIEELKPGTEYWFDVTSDTASQGQSRFYINLQGNTNSIETVADNRARMQLIPNPATEEVKVSFDRLAGEAQLKVVNVTGKVVFAKNLATSTGSVVIPVAQLANGIYMVELRGANAQLTQKLLKQ